MSEMWIHAGSKVHESSDVADPCVSTSHSFTIPPHVFHKRNLFVMDVQQIHLGS
jgi:hypothetical protein